MSLSTDRPDPGERRLRLAAIGDLHVGETGQRPYHDLFAEISARADVIALCGDLTNYGKTREAEILAEDLRAAAVPVVAVLGNHDHECGQPELIKQMLTDVGVKVLDAG